jgi:hypothetical protein
VKKRDREGQSNSRAVAGEASTQHKDDDEGQAYLLANGKCQGHECNFVQAASCAYK